MIYSRAAQMLAKCGIDTFENATLAPYTSFHIGGTARLVISPKSSEEAITALRLLQDAGARILVLGNGTNVLISDDGFSGAVLVLSGMRGAEYRDNSITADAGASITHIALEASKLSLTGMEFAYGIPGTVGGGIYMNAGAFGSELSSIVTRSEWFDLSSGEIGAFEGKEHEFAYRKSVYMDSDKVILSATFMLEKGDREAIKACMNDYMARRRENQPLEYPSAGSVFKRGNGFITAKLIEEAGLKGMSVGGAQVSEKHAGFIINRGGATAKDVLSLIDIIKATIKDKFDKTIECEIRYIES